jgi:hypothetical protein
LEREVVGEVEEDEGEVEETTAERTGEEREETEEGREEGVFVIGSSSESMVEFATRITSTRSKRGEEEEGRREGGEGEKSMEAKRNMRLETRR